MSSEFPITAEGTSSFVVVPRSTWTRVQNLYEKMKTHSGFVDAHEALCEVQRVLRDVFDAPHLGDLNISGRDESDCWTLHTPLLNSVKVESLIAGSRKQSMDTLEALAGQHHEPQTPMRPCDCSFERSASNFSFAIDSCRSPAGISKATPEFLDDSSASLMVPDVELVVAPSSQVTAEKCLQSIGRFTVTRTIGSGIEATVVEAIAEGQPRAVKIIPYRNDRNRGRASPSTLWPQPDQLPAVVEEHFAVWRRLHHPNVCPVLEALHDRENHCVCLVTPLYDPGLLRVDIDHGTATQLDLEQIKSFFLGVVRGMKYLHAKGIAHWDLKPENVLFDSATQQAKLIDFGVSEDLRSSERSGRTPWMRGTPLYWPPEMFDEVTRPIDGCAADVWAFGVMLYSAAVGRLPFNAPCITDLSKLVRSTDVQVPSALPPALQSLIMWVLSRQPEHRPTFADIRGHEFFSQN